MPLVRVKFTLLRLIKVTKFMKLSASTSKANNSCKLIINFFIFSTDKSFKIVDFNNLEISLYDRSF